MLPFNCKSFAYLFTPSINQIDLTNGSALSIATITPANNINAIGYYVTDGYMYGYDSTANQIAKLGIDGDLQDIFAVPNLPVSTYNLGDIDDDGYLYIILGASLTMYVIDLNPARPATYGNLVNPATKALTTTGTVLTGSIGGAFIGAGDWAFSPIDDQLYYVRNSDGIVRKVNPLTGVITQLTTNTAVSGQFGGIFFDPSGNLYASDNNSPNNIYRYTISGTTATRSLLSTLSNSAGGDGARCRYAPIYFATIDSPAVKLATPYSNVGGTITYSIILKNIGNIPAANVILIDTLPLGTTFIDNSVTLNGISKIGNPNPISGINLGTIPVGVSTVTFLALAASIPNPNPTPNTGNFSYEFTDPSSNTSYNSSAQSTTVSTTIVDLNITSTKVVSTNIAQIGDILTYTIVFTSTGNVTTSNLTFIDTIPNGTSYVPNSLNQDGVNISGTPNPPGATLTRQLASNDVSTVTFKVQITTVPIPNPIPNIATLRYSYLSNPFTSTSTSKFTSTNIVSTTIINANLITTKSVDKNYSELNDTITYTIVLSNIGNVDISNLVIKDTIPNYTTFIQNSFQINGVTQPGITLDPPGATIPDISQGEVSTLTFKVIVTTLPSPNPISNSANLTYTYTVVNASSGSLNTNIVSTTVTQAIINVTKNVNHEIINLGETLTYSLIIVNSGNTSGDVIIIDTIPSASHFITNSLKVNGLSYPGASILPPTGFTLNSLGSNQVATLTFDVLVTTVPITNPIYNDAFLSYKYIKDPAVTSGVTNTTNSNIVSTTVVATLISFSKFVDKSISTCSDTITYSIVLNNNGNTILFDTVLFDTLPSQLSFISNSIFVDNVNFPGVNLENGLNLGSLQLNQIKTITFKAIVKCD